jgi:hypothetical protein
MNAKPESSPPAGTNPIVRRALPFEQGFQASDSLAPMSLMFLIDRRWFPASAVDRNALLEINAPSSGFGRGNAPFGEKNKKAMSHLCCFCSLPNKI